MLEEKDYPIIDVPYSELNIEGNLISIYVDSIMDVPIVDVPYSELNIEGNLISIYVDSIMDVPIIDVFSEGGTKYSSNYIKMISMLESYN